MKSDNKMQIEDMLKAEGTKNIPILNIRKSFEDILENILFTNFFFNLSNFLLN